MSLMRITDDSLTVKGDRSSSSLQPTSASPFDTHDDAVKISPSNHHPESVSSLNETAVAPTVATCAQSNYGRPLKTERKRTVSDDDSDCSAQDCSDGDDCACRRLDQQVDVAFPLGSCSSNYELDDDHPITTTIQPPSNERLLGTAFISFMTFALLQLFFAFVADSEAMKGDSAAMIVDAMTYLFNWVAEHRKTHFDHDAIPDRRLSQRAFRKMVLQAELVPPAISVTTLTGVILFVLYRSVSVMLHRHNRTENPNVQLMMGFSLVNLGLDGLNMFCFARASHLMGYATTVDHEAEEVAAQRHHHHHHQHHHVAVVGGLISGDGSIATGTPRRGYVRAESSSEDGDDDAVKQGNNSNSNTRSRTPTRSNRRRRPRTDEEESGKEEHMEFSNSKGQYGDVVTSPSELLSTPPTPATAQSDSKVNYEDDDEYDSVDVNSTNLNMCSAYTHVFADTLRSFAVIIAAALAQFCPGVTPEHADATAAIVVSFLILLSLIPLLQGIVHSAIELQRITAQEQLEQAASSMLQQKQEQVKMATSNSTSKTSTTTTHLSSPPATLTASRSGGEMV